MKNLGKLLLLLLLTCSLGGYAQWSPININASQYASAIHFLTDDMGYALMLNTPNAKTLEKTTDGGQSWNTLNLPALGADFQSMHFHADGHGIAVFRDVGNQVTPTQIFMTTDDGAAWQDISPDTTAIGMGTSACEFLDDNMGYFATDDMLYKTVDGGTSWVSMQMSGYPMSLDFIDADHGTVGLFDGTFNYFGGMATTTDGGANWTTTWLTDNGTVIGKVGQWTTTTSWAAPVNFGAYGQSRFFKTTDNGLSWDTILVPDTLPSSSLSGIDFKDPMQGVITVTSFTTTVSYKTTDGGATWAWLDTLPYFGVSDLVLTANTGYLAGEFGILYKLDGLLGVSSPSLGQMHVFPNPILPGQKLQWDAEAVPSHATLIDMAGRAVHQTELHQPYFKVPELAPGIYFLRLETDLGVLSSKIIVE